MICMISHSVETPRGTGAFFFNTLVFLRLWRAGQLHSPYILLRKTPRNATGHGRGGG